MHSVFYACLRICFVFFGLIVVDAAICDVVFVSVSFVWLCIVVCDYLVFVGMIVIVFGMLLILCCWIVLFCLLFGVFVCDFAVLGLLFVFGCCLLALRVGLVECLVSCCVLIIWV